jgi:hypothetical protein
MIHWVLRTFIAAGVANLGAQSAERGSKLATTAHYFGGGLTNCRAVDIQRNTTSHCFNVIFA